MFLKTLLYINIKRHNYTGYDKFPIFKKGKKQEKDFSAKYFIIA